MAGLPLIISLGQNACQDGLWQKVPQSACTTEGLGSKVIWAMPKYTTCDKLIHRNIRCLKAFFLFVEASEFGVENVQERQNMIPFGMRGMKP